MAKYAIWNKQDYIITPVGELLSPEQWIARYPVAGLDGITVICAAGEINGAFFGTLGQMTEAYEDRGCDFSACTTAEEYLQAINDFDVAQQAAIAEASANATTNEELTATSLASIAASLEYQNMMTLSDVEEEEVQ